MGGVAGLHSPPQQKLEPTPAEAAKGGKHGTPSLQEGDLCSNFCMAGVQTPEMSTNMIGSTVKYITKRMMYNGKVSSDPSKNDFIQVGKVALVAIQAVEEVHGEALCAEALCSTKPWD